mmetsp:Transcript_13713/g.31333  ORF Transcript_13713/g.31333 Transcript_13713/m.31333 type:complete len:161 (+) Transcript_13713:884-1366(+)
MKGNYPFGTCVVHRKKSGGKGEYAICISSTVYKASSYWSGRWTSEWVLDNASNGSSLKGSCHVATHYYENGNVQFRSNRDFHIKDLGLKEGADPKEVAKQVAKHLSDQEFTYQEELQEALRDFSETTFKKLRRQLPLTQLTFPWKTGAASLAAELMARDK